MWFTIAWLAGTGHAGTVIGDCINGFNAVVAPTYIPGPYGPINGFTSIQDAIDAANDGDTICVLTGSYAEQLSITKEVTVQGWLGACQTTLAPMDGLGGPVVSVEAPNVTFDGFTVDGGGIHSGVEIRTSGSTVLHDLIFTNTVGTRGISINATSGVTEATNVLCQDPVTATLPGGHIYVGPEAILNSSGGLTVEQGSAPGGGGLFLDAEASATLDQSTFQFNTATSTTLYDGGGAILLGPNAVLSMSGGTLSNNHSSAHGGAINAALSSSSTVELSGTTVSHNTAAYGGGLAMSWTMPSILDGVDFQSNSALWEGGAIWSEFSDRVSIVDSTFAFNDAVTVGGGVYASTVDLAIESSLFCENSAAFLAALAHFAGRSFSLEQSVVGSIFADNTNVSPYLPAIYLADGDSATNSKFTNNTLLNSALFVSGDNIEIRNNLQTDHSDAVANTSIAGDQPALFQYQMFWNNAVGDTDFIVPPDATNLTSDPLLFGYATGSCDPAGLYPQWNSPVLDGGDPSLADLSGGRSDIGAFGGPSPFARPIFEDVDGDGFDVAEDCDDSDPYINPAAYEVCNTIDDNCNALIDDGPDGDGDLVPDICDPCPLDPLDDQDGDGVCDSDDPCPVDALDDSDGDGSCDSVDICPGSNDTIDNDSDGVPDGCDACNGFDDSVDTDGDGQPDDCDPCPNETPDDDDGDGICNSVDICPGGDDALDADSDGVPNACDPCPLDLLDDSDGDGVCDIDDQCNGFDDLADGDGDGNADGCDPCPLDAADDTDGDGVCDSDDVCPGANDTLDSDDDGTPDGCDPCPSDATDDSDGDGLCDSVDICPQFDDTEDQDEDGTPDGCDPCPLDPNDDTDGDGVCDSEDQCPDSDDRVDANQDGIPDGCAEAERSKKQQDVGGFFFCGCSSAGPVPGLAPLLLLAGLVIRRRS